MEDKRYYLVLSTIVHAPLREYLLHGYETRRDFEDALRRLVSRWSGRTGECVGERHGFILLRFHDTLGGKPDEAWIPAYLLQPKENPACDNQDDDEQIRELDRAFGF